MHGEPAIKPREYLESFLAYLVTHRRISPNTASAYRSDIELFVDFLHKKTIVIPACSEQHILAYLAQLHEKRLKAQSIQRKLSSLKTFFAYLEAAHQIANPAIKIQGPKAEKKLPSYLNEVEIKALLGVSEQDNSLKGQRNHIMLLTLYASGMRISEFLALQLHDVIFTTGFVRVMGKGGRERLIPLPHAVLLALRHYLDTMYPQFIALLHEDERSNQTLLFFNPFKGSPKAISRQAFWSYLKKLLLQAKIHKTISPHALRHSLASHLLKNGADLRSLQMLLGHQHLATVQIYTHLTDKQREEEYKKKHPRS